jgi:hexosaminidase
MRHSVTGFAALFILTLTGLKTDAAAPTLSLMPAPARVTVGQGALRIDGTFDVAVTGARDARIDAAAVRIVRRLSAETGIPMLRESARTALTIECGKAAPGVQGAIEDERYTLTVTPEQARLVAPTPYGVLRGIETFLQLVEAGPSGFQVPAVTIDDQPRFPWRGLLMDVSRHWMPVEVVKRNLDAMAAVKLNVLHWHLSDDQGFRVESKVCPRLQQLGSDGLYYTQNQIRDVVAYARERGIRVVPEFDMPGHSTAWFAGYPELAAGPGPYEIERGWGVFRPTMDPTREAVYKFLGRFIGEMAALFPDPYFHIGGDEVEGKQWEENVQIGAFKAKHGMKTNDDLQTYFNRRIQAILQKHGKRMVGWDEIFHPGLPKDTVVQSWRGAASLSDGASQGYQGILSAGYYLDHLRTAAYLYSVDPLGGKAAALPDDAKSRILGGEACMWAEYVTAETVDSRIWPRAAAFAERMWSPADVKDVSDMYRRMDVVSGRLGWLGVEHRAARGPMLERLTGYRSIEALEILADAVEPLGIGGRSGAMKYTSLTPFNRFVDAATPDNPQVRQFGAMVDAFLADPKREARREEIRAWLEVWKAQYASLTPLFGQTVFLEEVEPVSKGLADVASMGLLALDAIAGGLAVNPSLQIEALDQAAKPKAEVVLAVVPAVKKLAAAMGAVATK